MSYKKPPPIKDHKTHKETGQCVSLKEKCKSTYTNLKTPTADLLGKDLISIALNTFKKLNENTENESKIEKLYL